MSRPNLTFPKVKTIIHPKTGRKIRYNVILNYNGHRCLALVNEKGLKWEALDYERH